MAWSNKKLQAKVEKLEEVMCSAFNVENLDTIEFDDDGKAGAPEPDDDDQDGDGE